MQAEIAVNFANSTCTTLCQDPCSNDCSVSPLPSLPDDFDQSESHGSGSGSGSVSPLFVLMFCALAVAFSVIFCLTISKRRQSNLRNSLRRNRGDGINVTHHQEFNMDEDHDPDDHVFHPIWLINRVGLDQSVIDSINVVKYRKDEGLIEGTDCSVCLTEFEDDESLRLLPKCNHAFHVPCIDTWLRSHKNCPLCRAPIVKELVNVSEVSTEESNPNELSSREENPVENNESGDHLAAGENGHGEMRGEVLANIGGRKIVEILGKSSRNLNAGNSGIRVLSDLGDHRVKRGEELEAIRRSFSMDLFSIPITEHEGVSDARLVEANNLNLQKNAKGHKRSSSNIYKRVMKSSSFGLSSQKGPISMKRSYSSSGKSFSQFRHSKSQESILPL